MSTGETTSSSETEERPTGFIRLKESLRLNPLVGKDFPDELFAVDLPLFEDIQHPHERTITPMGGELHFYVLNRNTTFIEDLHSKVTVVLVAHKDVKKALAEACSSLSLPDNYSDWWIFPAEQVEYSDLREALVAPLAGSVAIEAEHEDNGD